MTSPSSAPTSSATNRNPRWEVHYRLDDWPERRCVRAATNSAAAWDTALDLADRGFADRIKFGHVERCTEHR